MLRNGWNALFMAAYAQNIEVVKALLNHKYTNPRFLDWKDLNAAQVASFPREHSPKLVKLLKEAMKKPVSPEILTDFIKNCSEGKNIPAIEMALYSPSLDINQIGYNNKTALSAASWSGNEEVVKLLLRHDDINVNKLLAAGQTALFQAAHKGHDKVIKQLIQMPSIRINHLDMAGNAALMSAVSNGHYEASKLLLDHKEININNANNFGWTGLMSAAAKGYTNIVKLFMRDANIDLNSKNKKGETALDMAKKNGHIDVIKLLSQTKDCKSYALKAFNDNYRFASIYDNALAPNSLDT